MGSVIEGVASKADVAGLKTGIANLRADLYRATWVQAGIVAAVVALVKLLP